MIIAMAALTLMSVTILNVVFLFSSDVQPQCFPSMALQMSKFEEQIDKYEKEEMA